MEKQQKQLHPEVAKEYELAPKAPIHFMSTRLNREIDLSEMKLAAVKNIEEYLLENNILKKKSNTSKTSDKS